MRYHFLLLTSCCLLVLTSCNRDSADLTTTGQRTSTLSAPAPAPAYPGVQYSPRTDGAPEPQIPREEDPNPESPKNTEVESAESLEAAKRMGPGRGAGIPGRENDRRANTSTTATQQQGTTRQPTTMSAPDQPAKPAIDYGRPLVTLSKTPCYGGAGCRQFSLTLTADRRLVLTPGRGMNKQGTYVRNLSAADYDELLEALEATEPSDLTATYPTDVKSLPSDVQASVLTYADVYGEPKKVTVYADEPQAVTAFLESLEKWVDEDFGWVKQM